MIKSNIEFRKGVLFLRISGSLERKESKIFKEQIFPIVLKGGFKFVVLNLDNLNTIDNYGIDILYDFQQIIKNNNGRVSFCNLNNKEIKKIIEESYINDLFYKTVNEMSSLEVFKI